MTIKHNKTNKLFSSIVTLYRVRDKTTHHIVCVSSGWYQYFSSYPRLLHQLAVVFLSECVKMFNIN